jgi:hypothetical protein
MMSLVFYYTSSVLIVAYPRVHAFKKKRVWKNVERKLLWEFFVVFIFIQTLKKERVFTVVAPAFLCPR